MHDQNRLLCRRWLLLIFLVGLALRVGWGVVQPSTAAAIDRLPDQREYLSLGQQLLQNRNLRFYDARFDQWIYAYRTPGYPLFIALCGANPLIVRLVQAVADASVILAVYLIAGRVSGSRFCGPAAAAVWCANPFGIYFSALLLSESLFTAALAWAMLLFLRRRWFWAGLVMLVGVYIRPSGLILSPLLGLVAGVGSNPKLGLAYRFKASATAVLITVLILLLGLLPWAWRNQQTLGRLIWTTTNSGITMYDGFNPAATGASDQRFVAEMPLLRSMNELQRSRYLQDAARTWIEQNPSRLPRLTLAKIARMWSVVPLSNEFGRPMYRVISLLYELPLDILVLIGLFASAIPRPLKLLLLMPAIYFTIVHALSVGSLRYRMPVEPELAVLAAAGLTMRPSNASAFRQLTTDN